MSEQSAFRNFSEFYPYYLKEHSDVAWLLLLPLIGYGFAWVGHYVFEKNRPATFKHPVYSLMGDWVMFRDILIGRIRF
ncbi:Mpo1-like protein [Marinobacter goseongensis]|uniref:Mpo1-like protein n=1 Tax=Marinobacter goseongensis TaxID=453838 RepID=UPI0020057470|nr:Mpo1-like protein [Marinobacter goseongensis]MCK7551853.1 DUF962 domain-containing protein [Marinobacter goseongensis]